jgi:hypothetical protein
VRLANENFLPVFDHYDARLKAMANRQSIDGIPSPGIHLELRFHRECFDGEFQEFYLPSLLAEVKR